MNVALERVYDAPVETQSEIRLTVFPHNLTFPKEASNAKASQNFKA
jgi:hypothetical protein